MTLAAADLNAVPTPANAGKFPSQIPFIIANEGCERFSFYGMRNILTLFLMTSLLLSIPQPLRAGSAKEVFHTFVIGVYFFPLLGGWLADRYFGKYNTVLWFSVILNVNLNALFVGAGALMAAVTLLFIAMPAARQMGLEVEESQKKATIAEILRHTDELPALRSTGSMPAIHL